MNKIVSIIGFIIIFFTYSNAQEFQKINDFEAIQLEIIEKNSAVNTLHSKFTQEKHLDILDQPFISSGEFFLKQPDFVRWEYQKPFSYIVVLKNMRVSIKDGDDLQNYDMSKNPVFKELNKVLNGLMNGRMLDDKNFETRFFQNNDEYKVTLMPILDKIKNFVQSIDIYFNKETLLVSKITMFEDGEDKTVISFENTEVNTNIEDSKFTNL